MKLEMRELLAGGPPLFRRLQEYAEENVEQFKKALWAGAGLMCSRAVVLGGLAPFGPAFLAGVPFQHLLPAYLGCVVGHLLPGSGAGILKALISLSLVLGFRWLLGARSKLSEKLGVTPLLALLSLLGAEALYLSFGPISIYDVLLAAAQGGLGAGAALFLRRSGELLERRAGLDDLNTVDRFCVVVSLGLLIIALSHFTIGQYSIGRAVTILLILLAAFHGKASVGCVAGTTAGACMILAGTPFPHLMGAYSLGGLLSGAFSLFGKVGCACAFIAVSGVSALVAGSVRGILFPLYEVLTATVVFMLLPKSTDNAFSTVFVKHISSPDETAKDSVAMKLEFSSKTLGDISGTLDKVAKKLEKKNTGDVAVIYGQAADEVCRHCGLRLFCWETAFHETMSALNSLTPKLEKNRLITPKDVPDYFAGKCCHLEQLTGSVTRNYTHFLAAQTARQRISEIREVALEQLTGMVEMLQTLSDEIREISAFDLKTAGQVKRLLQTKGIAYHNVAVSIDRFDRMTVELLLPSDVSFNKLNLLFRIDEVCGRVFDEPTISQAQNERKLTFCEKATLFMEFGSCQISRGGNSLCGDSYDYFLDGKGRAHLLISDGMGTGGAAAVDSAVTTGLLSKLVKAGFDYDAALKIVNCALIVKSGDESLSTIDVGCVDLYTGKAEFLKAGAAPTFLKKGNKVGRIETASLPAGILTGIEFQRTGIRLSKGDWIVMVSDGVTSTGVDWVISEIELFSSKLNPKELARRIAEQARIRGRELGEDDITVVTARLRKSS